MREENPTDLAAQQRQQEQNQLKAQTATEREVSDLRSVLSTAAGRRFMWGLLAKAGIYRNSFTGNSTTFFNEGQRNIGLFYLSMIEQHCPELFLKMYQEATAGKKESQ